MAHGPAYPHDPIEEIFPDLFIVRGSIQMNALMRITRNMAIVRNGGELTLVNPIRLDDAGEAKLRSLGKVAHLLRLGPMHGVDDPYYIDTFGAELWAQAVSDSYPETKPQRILKEGGDLPFAGAELFAFEGLKQPESALLVRESGGVLLTCDSIQHYGDYRHNNWLARIVMPFIGFPRTTLVGPMWLKMMTPEGASLESEFRRLLGLDFDHLLSAHGSFLRGGAHAAVEAAVDRAFPG